LIGVVGTAALLAAATIALGLTPTRQTKPVIYPDFANAKTGCGGGTYMTAGGFETDTQVDFGAPGNPYVIVDAMGPIGKKGKQWSAIAHNETVVKEGELTGYGYCSNLEKKPTVVREDFQINTARDDKIYPVEAKCPKDTRPVGGGFSTDVDPTAAGAVFVQSLTLGTSQSILVGFLNNTFEPQLVTAIAVCAKGAKKVKASGRIEKVPRGKKTGKLATASCPGKKKVVFGGFTAEYLGGTATFATSMYLQGKDAVSARGVTPSVSLQKGLIQAIAYCA